MKNLKLFCISAIALLVLPLLFISCGKAKTDANGCYYDIDDAAAVANKKNQDIMIIVTLEGDDAQSSDFMDKVVRNANFKKDIASKYAVVCMDFSQKSYEKTVAAEDASDAEIKAAEANSDLMQKNTKYITMLSAKDTPVIFILSKEQYFINGLYYDEENRSLEGFKKALEAKAVLIDEMHKMIYQTKIGTAEEKVAAIDSLFEATNPDYRIFLYDLLESVRKLDPTNKSGLTGKYIYEAAAIHSDLLMMEGKFREAIKAFIDVAEEPLVPAEDRQQAMYTAAYRSSMVELDEVPVIIGYLEKSIEIAPDSEQVPALKRVIAALSAQK